MPNWPRDFAASGLNGEVMPFIADMPAAFAQADLIVCRSGAGAVSELAAAGKPSILIPFPFAADDHQTKNAEAFERAGAAIRSRDRDWTGAEIFRGGEQPCRADPDRLRAMGEAARKLAQPGRRPPRCGNSVAEAQKLAKALTAWVPDRNNSYSKCFFHGSICTSRESAASA